MKVKLLAPEYQEEFAREVRRYLKAKSQSADAERAERRVRIAKLGEEIERYADAIASGISSAKGAVRERRVRATAPEA